MDRNGVNVTVKEDVNDKSTNRPQILTCPTRHASVATAPRLFAQLLENPSSAQQRHRLREESDCHRLVEEIGIKRSVDAVVAEHLAQCLADPFR